jgi:acetate kinase
VLFAGGIGENAAPVREAIAGGLAALGVEFDSERNRELPRGGEGPISAPGSRVAVWVVPTNEELLIARDTRDAIAAVA